MPLAPSLEALWELPGSGSAGMQVAGGNKMGSNGFYDLGPWSSNAVNITWMQHNAETS